MDTIFFLYIYRVKDNKDIKIMYHNFVSKFSIYQETIAYDGNWNPYSFNQIC